MRHGVVEGEPGIFPQPVADVMRRLGRWAERVVRRDRDRDEPDRRGEPDAGA